MQKTSSNKKLRDVERTIPTLGSDRCAASRAVFSTLYKLVNGTWKSDLVNRNVLASSFVRFV